PEIEVLGGMFDAFQGVWRNVALGEVGYRIAPRFEKYEDALTIGDPDSPEAHAHAPAQRLDVQQSLGQRFGHEESADCSRRERTLLPGQSHCCLPIGLMIEAGRRPQGIPDVRTRARRQDFTRGWRLSVRL